LGNEGHRSLLDVTGHLAQHQGDKEAGCQSLLVGRHVKTKLGIPGLHEAKHHEQKKQHGFQQISKVTCGDSDWLNKHIIIIIVIADNGVDMFIDSPPTTLKKNKGVRCVKMLRLHVGEEGDIAQALLSGIVA